jgi:hypothetical protein
MVSDQATGTAADVHLMDCGCECIDRFLAAAFSGPSD